MNDYWKKRWDKEKQTLLDQNLFYREGIMQRAYLASSKNLISKLTTMYQKIIDAGGPEGVTPNMIYQYNRYYDMLGECQAELEKLGVKLEKGLLNSLTGLYKATSKMVGAQLEQQGVTSNFDGLDKRAEQAAEMIWTDDGTNWSKRLWGNQANLQKELMDTLVSGIATGDSAIAIEKKLMERFSVSYSKAKTLVQTEMSHIMNQSSLDRMEQAGIKEWEWYTAEDERVCPVCRKLNGKRFSINDRKCPPDNSHPSCRCSVLAVVDVPKK